MIGAAVLLSAALTGGGYGPAYVPRACPSYVYVRRDFYRRGPVWFYWVYTRPWTHRGYINPRNIGPEHRIARLSRLASPLSAEGRRDRLRAALRELYARETDAVLSGLLGRALEEGGSGAFLAAYKREKRRNDPNWGNLR